MTGADLFAALPDHVRRMQEIGRIGSWHYDFTARRFMVSDVVLDLWGMDRGELDRSQEALIGRIESRDRPHVIAEARRMCTSEQPLSVRFRVRRGADEPLRWLVARGMLVRDADGPALTGTVADITDLVLAEVEAERATEELDVAQSYEQAIIAACPDPIHIYNVATGAISRANRSGAPLVGFSESMVKVMSGIQVAELVPESDLAELREAGDTVRQSDNLEVVQMRHRVREADDSYGWLSRRMTPFARDSHGAVTDILIVSRDATEVVAAEEKLQYAALHDDLTGLPNRRLARDRLEHALARTARGGHVAVLACDLDGFKRINDGYGHAVGDRVLIETAARLVGATRTGDTVARIGGDEFIVLLDIGEYDDQHELADQIARRLVTYLSEPIMVDKVAHVVTASIGISLADSTADAEELFANADTAMYFIKKHGGNGHSLFDPSQRPDTARDSHIERAVRNALAHEAIEVVYQPVVSPGTGSVCAVEALVRIPDGSGGYLHTGDAIELAERTGAIAELDERVFDIACRRVADWRRSPEHRGLTLNVNRSAKDIGKPGFYDRVMAALARTELPPHALTIEITETALLDADERSVTDLIRLNLHGIGLAIDDFGTGYAPLRYLAELPITCIKIDRSFTIGLPHDAKAMTLVRTTIGLAEQLGTSCVVEGVETAHQLGALPQYSRLLVQGYLYSQPLPASAALPAQIRAAQHSSA